MLCVFSVYLFFFGACKSYLALVLRSLQFEIRGMEKCGIFFHFGGIERLACRAISASAKLVDRWTGVHYIIGDVDNQQTGVDE